MSPVRVLSRSFVSAVVPKLEPPPPSTTTFPPPPTALPEDEKVDSLKQSSWAKLELDFCRQGHYKPQVGTPSDAQIESAAEEFKRRFMSDTGRDSGVPGVLVATNVDRAAWGTMLDRYSHKFVLTSSNELFMIQLASLVHTLVVHRLREAVGQRVETQLHTRNLIFCFQEVPSRGRRPDLAICPAHPWNPKNDRNRPRVICEVEYKHRGPSESREHGYEYLNGSPYHRAYVLVKIYPQEKQNKDFAAVAFVWRQSPLVVQAPPPLVLPRAPVQNLRAFTMPAPANPAEIQAQFSAAIPAANAALDHPVIGPPIFHQAIQFGTIPLLHHHHHHQSLDYFTRDIPADRGLPPVVIPAFGGRHAAVNISIPSSDVLYLCRDGPGNLLWVPPGAGEVTVDLAPLREELYALAEFEEEFD